jgi:hypothetical protein
MITRWSAAAPVIFGILQWEISNVGKRRSKKIKMVLVASCSLVQARRRSAWFEANIQRTAVPRKIASMAQANGGEATTIMISPSHAAIFRNRTSQRRFRKGEIAIARRSKAAPG